MAERALLWVVPESYVGGASTRRVEELVAALGVTNLSKSEASPISAGLDAEVDALRCTARTAWVVGSCQPKIDVGQYAVTIQLGWSTISLIRRSPATLKRR